MDVINHNVGMAETEINKNKLVVIIYRVADLEGVPMVPWNPFFEGPPSLLPRMPSSGTIPTRCTFTFSFFLAVLFPMGFVLSSF